VEQFRLLLRHAQHKFTSIYIGKNKSASLPLQLLKTEGNQFNFFPSKYGEVAQSVRAQDS